MAVFLGSGGQAGVHKADLGPALSSWTWRLPSTLGAKYCLGMYFWYEIWKGACACAFRQEEVRERSLFTLLPQTWRPSSAKETAAFSPSLILLCLWMMCGDMRHEKSAHTCFERELRRYAGYGKHEQRWECLCDLNERLVTRTAFHSPPLTRSHSSKRKTNMNKPNPPDRTWYVRTVCYKEQKTRVLFSEISFHWWSSSVCALNNVIFNKVNINGLFSSAQPWCPKDMFNYSQALGG